MMQHLRALILLFSAMLTACAASLEATEKAQKIQVMRQSNALIGSCSRLGPIAVVVDRVLPAQAVYDAAVWEAREKAATMGADSIVLLNSDHSISGLANKIALQAIALKCY